MTTYREKEQKKEIAIDKVPFGYVYKVTNIKNGKIYIGKAKEGRTGTGKTSIEKRWNAQIERAHRLHRWNKYHPQKEKRLRYIENAIVKYGKQSFILEELDAAFSNEELNEKERHWIKFFETRDHSKGYNLSEGGEGGGHHEKTIALLSRIAQEKAKNPEFVKKVSKGVQKRYLEKEYREKQTAERRARAKDPEWVEKMTQINQERAKDSEYRKKMSQIIKKRAKNPEWRKKLSNSGLEKWKDKKHIERQLRARERNKKKIRDLEIFLKDLQEFQKIDLAAKYNMASKTINIHIQHLLGHRGITNYTEARKYLENKKLVDVLKDIENYKEKQFEDKIKKREKLQDTKQFLEDIQEMEKKDIDIKYSITSKTTNNHIRRILGHQRIENYTQAREYLRDKEVADVLKETKKTNEKK